ncbi:hypothetical protein R9T42_01470, partial [Escherichia coli]
LKETTCWVERTIQMVNYCLISLALTHVYRELVNRLHDTAIKCAGTQQLRERISRVLGDVITPDHHKQAEKSGLERCRLEAALNIKPGHTLGIIDALLVHKMARALLPLVAEKHEVDHANES